MKVKKKTLGAIILIIGFFIAGVFALGSGICDETSTSKECSNILTGKKSLELYPERYFNGEDYIKPEYGLINGTFRDYKGAIYNYNPQGFLNVYSIQNELLNEFAFAISANIGPTSYTYSSLNFSWTWDINHNQITDEYTFIGYNNNPNFNWTQEFHFYPDREMKIYHHLTNNLGQTLENTKFWYINKVNNNSFIFWNQEKYYLDESFNINGDLNDAIPKINFGNIYSFNYSDLIDNDFNISNIYGGDGGVIGYPNIDILAIGVTKGNGNFLNGSSITLDPSLDIQSGTTILGGDQEYTTVFVNDGATLQVNETIGFLNITATVSITIYGTVDGGEESNYSGGTSGSSGGGVCGNGGGGGAGQGDNGGSNGGGGTATTDFDGCNCATGSGGAGGAVGATQIGNETIRTILLSGYGGGGGGGGTSDNSAGNPGGAGGVGGNGGAGIRLFSSDIFINGTITSNGGDGGIGGAGAGGDASSKTYGGGGGAGGSGGTIIIDGLRVNISSVTINVDNGDGGVGGTVGGGSCAGGAAGTNGATSHGGRIKIFFTSSDDFDNSSISTNLGVDGTIYYEQTDGSEFNAPPTLATNETIPTPDLNTQNIFLNITTFDADNDSIDGVFFTVNQSNGTIKINHVNGTWISGDSVQGENETWESERFNITNLTGEVGQWNWSVTIQSNGTNANTTATDFFIITDSENPSVNMTSLESNQVWNRNISIPINFTASDNVEVDSCLFSLNNGTTNTTLPGCGNSTFSVDAGNYYSTLWVNDTSNNFNTTIFSNITIIEDIIDPVTSITNPVGTLSSRLFTTKIGVVDAGGTLFCEYNITQGAATEVATTNLTFNSGTGFWEDSTTVSTDADYVVNANCYDYGGLNNFTNGTFSVDTSVTPPPGGGGGGGRPQVIIINGTAQWSVETDTGGNVYDFRMVQGSARDRGLVYENLGASSVKIKLTCEDQLCEGVEFEDDEFELPIGLEIPTAVMFTLTIPSDLPKGEYITNIVSTDSLNNRGVITVRTNVGTFSLLISPFIKLTSSKTIGQVKFPYFAIFLFFVILVGFVSNFTFLKDAKFGPGLALLLGLIAGYVALLIL